VIPFLIRAGFYQVAARLANAKAITPEKEEE
jgi:hypothetical protein